MAQSPDAAYPIPSAWERQVKHCHNKAGSGANPAGLKLENRMETLIIGGPHDGEWHNVRDGLPFLRLDVRKPISISSPLEIAAVPASETYQTADYKLEVLRTPVQQFQFYRHIDISLENALGMLFSRYGHPTAACR